MPEPERYPEPRYRLPSDATNDGNRQSSGESQNNTNASNGQGGGGQSGGSSGGQGGGSSASGGSQGASGSNNTFYPTPERQDGLMDRPWAGNPWPPQTAGNHYQVEGQRPFQQPTQRSFQGPQSINPQSFQETPMFCPTPAAYPFSAVAPYPYAGGYPYPYAASVAPVAPVAGAPANSVVFAGAHDHESGYKSLAGLTVDGIIANNTNQHIATVGDRIEELGDRNADARSADRDLSLSKEFTTLAISAKDSVIWQLGQSAEAERRTLHQFSDLRKEQADTKAMIANLKGDVLNEFKDGRIRDLEQRLASTQEARRTDELAEILKDIRREVRESRATA